ncbi:DUF7096 domain-containing protein [Natronoarchaeum rubrum]|uniref:DUF7096 domain-containing protein n=1 Tax=Natronoarchaeum rubrum TaxID=755311 RepID=UPI00211380ED|nr:hypothetical protein [Natronoarchaeum rubrum]
MSSFRAGILAAVVVLGTLLAVPFAGALAVTDSATVDAQDDGTNATDGNVTGGNATDGNGTGEPSVGVQISSFMQTSTTNATSEVESGMFEAEYKRANNRTAVVEKRANRIERQIAQLRDRKQDLAEREGELNEVAYTAQMSRIVSEIGSLERQINGTAAKADDVGIDAEQFDRMRANVSELRGPKVQAATDAIPGRGPPTDRGPGERGPSDDRGDGPPEDVGNSDGVPDNGPPDVGESDNASDTDQEDRAGSGANRGDTPGNDRGPSDDGGPGDRSADGKSPDDNDESPDDDDKSSGNDDEPSDNGPGRDGVGRPDVTLVQ